MLSVEECKQEFIQKQNIYDKLGSNLKQALELILQENEINFLSVYYRIKDIDSFIEKIERKSYKSPFEEVEDICGLRIICYYPSTVDAIVELLKKELKVIQSQDKEELLETDQFGYRSHHLIIQIPAPWLKTPNYKKLKNLKAEIQIRTVLMHAWAEIEHELAYKKTSHVPQELRRQLSRLSAKLEEADEQFEDLKNKSTELKQSIIENKKVFDETMALNLDTLQAFLDIEFPDRVKNLENTRRLLDELIRDKISFKEIKSGHEKLKPYLKEIENSRPNRKWVQVGIVRYILDLTNKNYLKRLVTPDGKESPWYRERMQWKKKLNLD